MTTRHTHPHGRRRRARAPIACAKALPLTLAYVCGGALGFGLYAQQPAPVRTELAPPIVVTARAQPRPSSKTPGSVSVIGEDRILEQAPISVSDALQSVPGVAKTADGAWGADLNIRGLSRESVVLLIDGCRVNTATDLGARFGLVDPMDIERVEVLKGPISALYGSGSLGGIVNVLTHAPAFSDEPAVQGRFSGSLWSNPQGARGFCSGSASSADTSVYASQSFREHESYRDGDGDEVRNSQFRDMQTKLRVAHRPAEGWRIDANLQVFRGEEIGVPGSGTAPLPAQADVTYPETERYLCSLLAAYSSPTGPLRESRLNLYHQRIERQARIDNFPPPHPMQSIKTAAPHTTWGAKWLNTLAAGAQTVTTGLDVWQRELKSTRLKTLKTGLQVREQPLPDSAFTAAGVFAEDDWEPAPNLVLNAGGRLDAIRVDNDSTVNWAGGAEDESSWNLHVGLTWHPAETIVAKCIVGSGYRAASLEERYQYLELGDGRVKYGDPALVPERSVFAECGLGWQGDTLALGATAFCVQLDDLIGERVQDASTIVNANIDKAQLYGAELETTWLPAAHLQAYGHAGWTLGYDTENDEYLPDVAPLTALLGIAYGQDRPGPWTAAETRLAAEQDRMPDGFSSTPGWCTVDLRAGYRFAKGRRTHNLQVGVCNLFDATYRNHLTTYRGALFNEPGRAFVVAYTAQL
ncbi:MAG: TonB-dependent receptor [Kiritimatiellae bacterium]|nr:TonB-dependent receptor [Kiritimatiellia bacterium]